MRVLITNNTLDHRAGSELYVRDIALALLRRGHHPIAYSTRLGTVADELRVATVPVIDDLNLLTVIPDIIHGQHHLDAMTALLHFPIRQPSTSVTAGFPGKKWPLTFRQSSAMLRSMISAGNACSAWTDSIRTHPDNPQFC